MPTQQTAAFKKAVDESRKLKAKPGDSELLQVCERIKLLRLLYLDADWMSAAALCLLQAGYTRSTNRPVQSPRHVRTQGPLSIRDRISVPATRVNRIRLSDVTF